MKTLKKFCLIAALVAVSVVPSFAQTFKSTLNGGTNTIAATSTNTYSTNSAYVVNVPRSRFVSVQPSFALVGAGTSTVTFTVDGSTDGSIWTNSIATISIAASGTNVMNTIATIDAGGFQYLRPGTGGNPNASIATNVMVNFSFKPGI